MEPSGLEQFVSVPGGYQMFSINSLTRSSRGKRTCSPSLRETYRGGHRGISCTGHLLSQSVPSLNLLGSQGAGGEETGTRCHLGGCSGSTGDEEAMAQRLSVTQLHWYSAMATPRVR